EDADVERSANGDPGGRGRDTQGESQYEVRERSEAFGEGVSEDDAQRDRREAKAQRVELPRGQDEHHGRDHDESPSESSREQSGGNVAEPSARITPVDVGVDQPVEGHGRRASPHHGEDNPADLAPEQ